MASIVVPPLTPWDRLEWEGDNFRGVTIIGVVKENVRKLSLLPFKAKIPNLESWPGEGGTTFTEG